MEAHLLVSATEHPLEAGESGEETLTASDEVGHVGRPAAIFLLHRLQQLLDPEIGHEVNRGY